MCEYAEGKERKEVQPRRNEEIYFVRNARGGSGKFNFRQNIMEKQDGNQKMLFCGT